MDQPENTTERRTLGQAALTPLLDTLFLLLFSVLAASDGAEANSKAHEEVQLELPSVADDGAGQGASAGDAPVVLAIGADGAVSVEGEARELASPAALDGFLAGLSPGATFEIRAHADARHAVVVEVLHGLREAGFLDVSLVATRRGSEAPASGWGGSPR